MKILQQNTLHQNCQVSPARKCRYFMSVERRSAGKFCARAAAVCGVLARCAVSPNTRNIVSISSIYYLLSIHRTECRLPPDKGINEAGQRITRSCRRPWRLSASAHTFQPSFGCRELGIIIYIGEYKLSAEGTGLDGGCSGQCPGWSGDMRRYSA